MRAVRHPGELRWETRLLAVIVATLVVFGIIAVYGASSLTTSHGQIIGPRYALTQVSGAAFGGVLLIIASRIEMYACASSGASLPTPGRSTVAGGACSRATAGTTDM